MTEVDLRPLRASLQGVIPSPFATCSAEGMPNVTYLSLVAYVDAERVATSRQFLSKSRENLRENPRAQVIVVDPESGEQHVLDLRYLHTEVEGEVFEALRANLDAAASQTGMGDVFRLRGADIHRVERCVRLGAAGPAAAAAGSRDLLEPVEQVARRLAGCTSYEEVARVALEALDDQLGLAHAILLAHDAPGGRLFAVAGYGYEASAVGAEVAVGDGLIGTAALRGRLVVQSSLQRSQTMARAVTGSTPDPRDVPLPGLRTARSAAAVPLPLGGEILGVLYVESERAAAFVGAWEPALRLLGAHLAAALAARGAARGGPAPRAVRAAGARGTGGGGRPLRGRRHGALRGRVRREGRAGAHPLGAAARARGHGTDGVQQPRAAPRRVPGPARRERQPGGAAARPAPPPGRGCDADRARARGARQAGAGRRAPAAARRRAHRGALARRIGNS